MATPPTAFQFAQGIDPSDELDFVIPLSPWLEVGEQVATYDLTLLPEAVALGLTIMTGSGRDHDLIEGDTAILMWFEIADGLKTNPAFDGSGVSLPFEVTFVTTSIPARTRQFTALLPVVQK